jgi:hypothetical protein
MLAPECLNELRTAWLPHITDTGLDHLIELLEKDSPFLIHGSFARAVPQGCLATHIAWHHPQTEHLTLDAGVCWLNRVAGLNPATSQLIRAWDKSAGCSFEVRSDLLAELKECRRQRQEQPTSETTNRVKDLVESI